MMRLKKRPIAVVPLDMAPLIDVVLQLLLFFMLTSSFVLYPGIRVTLPRAQTSKNLAASNLVITLTKDHLIYWEDELVTFSELRGRLQSAGSSKPVLIRADRYAYVEKLIALWDLCRDTGYREVQIATITE